VSAHLADEPPVTAPNAAVTLSRVGRVLRYAASDQGLHLWRLAFIERTCRPVLVGLAGADASIADAADALDGLDAKPWTERLPFVERALEALDAAELVVPEPELEPAGQLVITPDLPEAPKEPKSNRRRGRRGRGRREPEVKAEPVEVAPPPPPPKPRRDLRHPDGAGRSLTALGPAPDVVARLAEHGVESIADLLLCMPSGAETVAQVQPDEPLPDTEDEVALSGTVKARWLRFGPTGQAVELALEQGDRVVNVRWLGKAPSDLPVAGENCTLVGRLELDEEAVLYEAQRWWPDGRGNIRRPTYGIPGLDDALVRGLMREALVSIREQLHDPLPPTLLQDSRVARLEDALTELHLPSTGGERGRARFAFEDLLYYQIALASREHVRLRGIGHPVKHGLVTRLQQQENLHLEDDQEAVFDEIKRDLRRPHAMARLLQGDVGSGKALIALFSAVMVAETKAQVVFLAPDAIAAEHRYLFAERMLRGLGLVPRLVGGRVDAGLADALKRGEVHALFATHDILKDFPGFKKLGLVVVEERNAFRVVDRAALSQKGTFPDLLVISSVPVPTSLTFTVFADHDISVIKTTGQQRVQAWVRTPAERDEIYATVRGAMDEGRQAYLVFPMLEGRDIVPLPNARQLVDALATEAFPGARLALYHSGMSREERFRVFDDFQRRLIDVLVATTAIEDAPEVANATVMVVENADRYDLVRLHRVRGHVARGRDEGTCIFVLSDNPDPAGKSLVERLSREQDGFAIAEQDRVERGDEALLGDRKSEMPTFRVADTSRDRALLLRARRAALRLLQQDPELKQRAHRHITEQVYARHADLAGDRPTPPEGEGGGSSRRRRRRRRRKSG
jgi:ATP-dependent DNA helicase RecG